MFVNSIVRSSPFNLTLAMLIVGSSVVVSKYLSSIPVFLVSEIRFILSTLLFAPFLIKVRFSKIDLHDFCILCLMAFCGQVLFTVLLLIALEYLSGISVGAITSTTPLFMTIASVILFKEKLTKKQLISLLLSLGCILSIFYDSYLCFLNADSKVLLGLFFIILAVIGESLFLLLSKKLHTNISGLNLTFIMSLLGALLCLPFSFSSLLNFEYHSLDTGGIISLLYIAFIYTNLAYVCWFYGVSKSSGVSAGLYTVLMPVSACFYSMIMLNESISIMQILALILSVCAIVLSNTKRFCK